MNVLLAIKACELFVSPDLYDPSLILLRGAKGSPTEQRLRRFLLRKAYATTNKIRDDS